MPRSRAWGGGSEQRARAGSFGAPGGCRFGGRADLRERLLGSGVLGSDDLAEAELVFDELPDELVVEGFRKLLGSLGIRDLDALVQIVSRGEVALRQLVQPRVLKVPDGARLTNELADEADDTRLHVHDPGVLADLALGCRAFFLGHIGRQGE